MKTRKTGKDRRGSQRKQIRVQLVLADTRGALTGFSMDASRGGIFAATNETRPVGTLLRLRVVSPQDDSVTAVGVVVRCFDAIKQGRSSKKKVSPGLAIALTATSDAWDRFWEHVNAQDNPEAEDDRLELLNR
jgi:hypothetical protein